jgi:arylsulfatase
LIEDKKDLKALKQARALLAKWTEQTGDSIPDNPTPNRHDPPRIENGKILPPGKAKIRNPHAEMPGASRNASKINHPGPIKI